METKKREYFFGLATADERDGWLNYFNMLFQLRDTVSGKHTSQEESKTQYDEVTALE